MSAKMRLVQDSENMDELWRTSMAIDCRSSSTKLWQNCLRLSSKTRATLATFLSANISFLFSHEKPASRRCGLYTYKAHWSCPDTYEWRAVYSAHKRVERHLVALAAAAAGRERKLNCNEMPFARPGITENQIWIGLWSAEERTIDRRQINTAAGQKVN